MIGILFSWLQSTQFIDRIGSQTGRLESSEYTHSAKPVKPVNP